MFYDVFGPSWSLHHDLERILDEMNTHGGRPRRDGANLNVWANDEAIAVTAEVPGVDAASINLSIVGDTLTVSGKREALDDGSKRAAWHRRERGSFEFNRTIQLPFSVDPDQTEARVKDGVLTVALRRTESDKPRRIAVTAA